MRQALKRAVLVLLALVVFCGRSSQAQNNISELEKTVSEAYDLGSLGIGYSTTQKYLTRGGDEVAVLLVHLISRSTPNDQQIERICVIIDYAFRAPQLITETRDRKPDVALLLLDSERTRTNDPSIRNTVSTLKSRLLSLYK